MEKELALSSLLALFSTRLYGEELSLVLTVATLFSLVSLPDTVLQMWTDIDLVEPDPVELVPVCEGPGLLPNLLKG